MSTTRSDVSRSQCIAACLDCHQTCLEMAMTHCLQKGGKHVEPEHFRLMLNCVEICLTSAHFMMSGSDLHRLTCKVCADVCGRCAESCAALGDMEKCVTACHRCAKSCSEMAQ